MAGEDQIATLELLQRIKQQETDRVGKMLSQIRAEQLQIETELEDLSERSLQETRVDTPEAMAFIPGFLRAIEQRSAYLREQLAELDERAAEIEKELLAAFTDSKTNETALDAARLEAQAEEERQQDAELSEIALNTFLRQRGTP